MELKCQFASDNTSGICPEAWFALERANQGYVQAYGHDKITSEASDLFREVFNIDCDVYFVFNGTAANSLSLASLCASYHSVIVHELAHVETDECGGPEFFSNGTKLLLGSGAFAKLCVEDATRLVTKRTDIHYPRPRVISLTQATELGTVYYVEEVRALARLAEEYGLKVHVDGARLGNAISFLNVKPQVITWELGVDVISVGGTKTGGISDAVVFFDRSLSEEFAYRCKQAGQLASKMRFLAAPWTAMLRNGLWLKYSHQANELAQLLRSELEQIEEVRVLYPTEANSVFVDLPTYVHDYLKENNWYYYVFIGGGARFMCSWKTTHSDVEALVLDVKKACSKLV